MLCIRRSSRGAAHKEKRRDAATPAALSREQSLYRVSRVEFR
jgi:hypothetical protein